ncbi:MAG: CcmD family protein [bacterium]
MSDLTYASLTILIIWGGIFFYLFTLDRRLRRLEEHGARGWDVSVPEEE